VSRNFREVEDAVKRRFGVNGGALLARGRPAASTGSVRLREDQRVVTAAPDKLAAVAASSRLAS
jgi:hypothetical protein